MFCFREGFLTEKNRQKISNFAFIKEKNKGVK